MFHFGSSPSLAGRPVLAGGSGSLAADLRDILATLRRRVGWIVGCGLAALALGAVATQVLVPRYVATMDLVIDPRGLEVLDKELTPRAQTTDVNTAIVETQAKVLVSDSVLRRVVDREGLAADPEFNGIPSTSFGRLVRDTKQWLGLSMPESDPALAALSSLRRRTVVRRIPASFVVTLSVSTPDPDRSAAIATAIGAAYVEAQSDARRAAARRASEALSARLQELRERVNRAENEIERYRAGSDIVGANGRLVNEQQLSELSTQLVAAQLRASELRARWEQIDRIVRSGALPDGTLEATQSPLIAQLRTRYAEIKGVEDDLATKLGGRHPDIAAMRAQSANLRQRIGDELRRLAAAARTDFERAAASRDALSARLTELTGLSNRVNESLVKLRELEREAQASRTIYENFLNRVRETREQQEIDTGNTRIISPPVPPAKPAGLPALVMLVVAGIVGIGFGAVSAVARDGLDGRAHTARQVTAQTGLPVLAVLSATGAGRVGVAKGRVGREASSLARLHHRLKDDAPERPRILVVTSPDDRSGKSGLARDLAEAASRAGDRVLLVDGDPVDTLSRGLGPAKGSELVGRLSDQSWRQPEPVGGPGLRAISGSAVQLLTGPAPAGDPKAVATRPSVRQVAEAAGEFDLVIVDAGLFDSDPEAWGFLDAARQILLVLRADGTRLADIEAVRTGLGALSTRVAGAVLLTGPAGRRGA